MAFEKELETARLAVQLASLFVKAIRPLLEIDDEINKDDDTPVTLADLSAQALVISVLHATFPADGFLAEESAKVLRDSPALASRVWKLVSTVSDHLPPSAPTALHGLPIPGSQTEMLDLIDLGKGEGGPHGRFWILDPIDGTVSYMMGEQYAVCLCLVENGAKTVAAQGCPNLSLEKLPMDEGTVDLRADGGLLVSAVRGGGCWMQCLTEECGRARRVPGRAAGKPVRELGNVESLKSGSMDHARIREVCERLGVRYPGVNMWAQQMKYICLALGGHDLMVRIPAYEGHRTAVWDHASGQLICEEVGVKMTDVFGRDHDYGRGRRLYGNWGDVAAPPELHGEILRVVSEVLSKSDG